MLRSPGGALYGPLTGDSLRFVEKLWINCVILQFYPQKICSLHHFTIAGQELKVDYTSRDSEYSYSELCGSGNLRAERSGDQEAFGRNGPGPGSLGAERSKDQEAFGWNDPRIRKP